MYLHNKTQVIIYYRNDIVKKPQCLESMEHNNDVLSY